MKMFPSVVFISLDPDLISETFHRSRDAAKTNLKSLRRLQRLPLVDVSKAK